MINKSYKDGESINSLKKAMDKDHLIIHNLLNKFEKEISEDFEKSKNTFNRLRWILEKHFFVEEKIIFSVYLSIIDEENEYINKLLMEHEKIFRLLNEIEEDLLDNKKSDISEIKLLLRAHSRFEDDFFYPKIDEEISEKEKLKILNRIEEVIIK
ncbi:MAG: hemerythrin domain-containing protein [Candidatus Nanoarchaeia archaeon]|nr:hemerythrin domain-containing protein [Candidatus Nanoarchaeia archaeon]